MADITAPPFNTPHPSRSAYRRAVLQALLVTFLWSTSWVLIKVGLVEIPPATFAGLRYTLAFVCLVPFALRSPGLGILRRLHRREWGQLIALGLIYYTLTQGAQFVGLAYLPAVTVNLALSLTAVVVALLGFVLLGERPRPLGWLGSALSVAGGLVFFYPARVADSPGIGLLVVIIGVLANAGAALLSRTINRRGDLAPLMVTFVSMGCGGSLLLVFGLAFQGMPPLSPTSWAIIAWLAVVNTAFAFTLWNLTLRTLHAMESAIINNTMMVQIPILAVLFLGERLTGQEIAGLGLATLGTVLVSLRR